MRFLVDINVGKLARLLRMLGYDALLFRGDDDNEMIAKALSEKRTILTRDLHFLNRKLISGLKAQLIGSEDPDEQLGEVVRAFGLNTSAAFTRCIECNERLAPYPKEEAKALVPQYVYQTQEEFKRCPSCGRIYWKGTHWQRMVQRLEKLNKQLKPAG